MNAERLLGNLIKGAVGSAMGGRRSGLNRMLRGNNAAVGMGLLGLAVGAFEHFSQQQAQPPVGGSPSAPPPMPRSAPPPLPVAQSSAGEAELMIRAMIAAANADGVIDPAERAKILERAGGENLGDDVGFVERELQAPLSLDALVAAVAAFPPKQELRDQIYFVSLLAIRADSVAEQRYLQALAERLSVSPAQRNAWHQLFGMDPVF